MKIWLAFVALTAAHGITSASEWKALTSSENNIVFVDIHSVQAHGRTLRKAWFISNRESPEEVPGTKIPHMSSKYLAHFSCREKTIAIAAVYFYAQKDGIGQVVSSSTTMAEFIDVAPDSVNEEMLRFVCAKSKM